LCLGYIHEPNNMVVLSSSTLLTLRSTNNHKMKTGSTLNDDMKFDGVSNGLIHWKYIALFLLLMLQLTFEISFNSLIMRQAQNLTVVLWNCFLLGKGSAFLVSPLLGMAKILGSIGKATKAIEVYQRVISILESSRGAESKDLVVPLSGLGNLLIKEGRATDAESLFNRLLYFLLVSLFNLRS